MECMLQINKLRKEYDGFVLDDLSFSIGKGIIMGFIGPNGAGKTTTLKLIMNLLKRDAGEIKVFGRDNRQDEVLVRQEIGFVYEDTFFYEELTPAEMGKIIAPLYKKWDWGAYCKYLQKFTVPQDKKIKLLSRGTRMKVSLAAALSHQARLLLMDEPTSGLDPVFRNELLDIFRDYMNEQRSILFSTHVTSDLEKVADAITMINQGRVVFSLSSEDIAENYVIVKGEKKALTPELKQDLIGFKEGSFGFKALAGNGRKLRQRWGDALLIERASLEDLMLYTIRGKN